MGSSLTQGFNYVRLGEVLLTGAAASMDLQNIPSGYTFLVVYLSTESAGGVASVFIRLNNDNGANHYTVQYLKAVIGVVSAGSAAATEALILDSAAAAAPVAISIQINQIPLSDDKGFHSEGGTSGRIYNTSGYWESSAEINRITIEAGAGTFDAGSSMIVYGVR